MWMINRRFKEACECQAQHQKYIVDCIKLRIEWHVLIYCDSKMKCLIMKIVNDWLQLIKWKYDFTNYCIVNYVKYNACKINLFGNKKSCNIEVESDQLSLS